MQDNARPHTAHVVRNYLAEAGNSVIAWPAGSPDFNSIKHIWDIHGRRIRDHPNCSNNLEDVECFLFKISVQFSFFINIKFYSF